MSLSSHSLRRLLPGALLAVSLTTLLLGSCAPVLQRVVQVPTFTVVQTRLTGLTIGSPAIARVTLRLRVENPNPVSARLANFSGSFFLDGAEVGDANLPNIDLPARSSTEQLVYLEIPVSLKTAAIWLQVARGREMPYRVDGTFTADLGAFGQPSFGPYTLAQGVFKQPAILP
ncbi:LEA type 2 family protein [Deinococcus sp.]|uniref:LEA type 2 family protein n=1 Tax=Deinococcus sp. TaxID=47478 RepID=UPI003B5C5C96